MAGKNWIATVPLNIGWARAFSPGDVVPDAHVEEYGWHDGVVREGTKASAEAKPDEPAPATATK